VKWGENILRYGRYEIIENKNGIKVKNINNFEPKHIFGCGQCFRWIGENDGSYTGVTMGRVINVKYEDRTLEIKNTNTDEFLNIWFDYFDLGTDYNEIKNRLQKDDIMEEAIRYGHGIRILRQDLWETIVSFIISANNRIPMIMRIVASIAGEYGDEIKYGNKSYYTFPTVTKIAGTSLEKLAACKAGFRCKYILGTSQAFIKGEPYISAIENMNIANVKEQLVKLPGIGDKVADCILLYSGIKRDVFPVDVWVRRVMEKLYFKRKALPGEIRKFASEYFKGMEGFAQQYLFYYARENGIGTDREHRAEYSQGSK